VRTHPAFLLRTLETEPRSPGPDPIAEILGADIEC
jgi:hypothetical protein